MNIPNSRNFRNNNPGNIRHSDSKWLGMSDEQKDSAFVQFDNMFYGVRALTRLLHTYRVKYHIASISKILNKFAPRADKNSTDKYIEYCSKVTGLHPDAVLCDPYTGTGARDYSHLISAISSYEAGTTALDDYIYALAMLSYSNLSY